MARAFKDVRFGDDTFSVDLTDGRTITVPLFPLRCPDCGATMRILAFLTDPEPVPELDLDQTRAA